MRQLFTVLTFLTIISTFSNAQDIHFSHIHASPTYLNPAMNGVFNDGSIRFTLNSRLQWESFTNGYKTIAGTVDAKLAETANGNILSGGLQLFSDRAGDLNFTTNSAALSLAVLQSLDRRGKSFLSVGLQGAYSHQKFNTSNMIGHELEDFSTHGLSNFNNYWDVSGGISWYYSRNKYQHFYLGGALFHINQPNTSFFPVSVDRETQLRESGKKLYRKIVLHGGGKFRTSRNTMLLPSFIFTDQGPHREILIGSFLEYQQRKLRKGSPSIYVGAWMRWYLETDLGGSDALVLSIRLDKDNTSYTFSFDTNISSLAKASQGIGGPELSVIKIIGQNSPSRKFQKVKCPAL